MHKSIKLLFGLLLLLLLAGCANDPVRIRHYTLPLHMTTSGGDAGDAPTFISLTLQLADYLQAPGVVYQTSEIELEAAYSHRWADSLEAQLEQGLRARLLAADDHYRFVRSLNDAGGFQVEMLLDRFHGRYDGHAVISGQWLIRSADGDYLAGQPFNVQKPLTTDGYPALVRSLGAGWAEVTADIAAQLSELKSE